MTRPLAVAALVAAALPLGACSTAPPTPVAVASPLPAQIVPTALPTSGLTLQLDTTRDVQRAVRSVGDQILTSDVKFWQIHLGERLVGALQLSTLKSRVNTAHALDRRNIVSQILVGETAQIYVRGLPVWTTAANSASPRTVYIWFGAHNFGVLQLQARDIDQAKVAESLITQVATQPAWGALPPQAYGES